jgi:multidrug efflux pump subunit AcrA (membrane-fusion protein)
VRVTIPIRSTQIAGPTVPLSAVSLAPDGRARVQRSTGKKLEFVPVKTGLSADGYVSVAAREGSLVPGDRVVVGFRRNGRGGTS